MKQHVTIENIDKLTDSGKEKLRAWWKPKDGQTWEIEDNTICFFGGDLHSMGDDSIYEEKWLEKSLPLLSIGQMIEFLNEKAPMFWSINRQEFTEKDEQFGWSVENYRVYGDYVDDGELCDALWEACVEILNKE